MTSMVKNMPAMEESRVQSLGHKDSLGEVNVFLPGVSHEERSLTGYSPWVTESQTQMTNSK